MNYMKTLFLALALTFVTTLSFSQLNKGDIHLSGSSDLSFGSIKSRIEYDGEKVSDEVSQTSFNFNPGVGYFVSDNCAIGLSMTYEYTKVEDAKATSTLIGPYAAYYFGTTNIRPYLRADIAFGAQKEEEGSEEYKMDAFAYDFGGGIAVFVNDYVSLDFGLAYVNMTYTDPDDSDLEYISDGVTVTGGISVYF